MIRFPHVSKLGGSAETFESRIKIPKALGELEEGPKAARMEFNNNKGEEGSAGRASCTSGVWQRSDAAGRASPAPGQGGSAGRSP